MMSKLINIIKNNTLFPRNRQLQQCVVGIPLLRERFDCDWTSSVRSLKLEANLACVFICGATFLFLCC